MSQAVSYRVSADLLARDDFRAACGAQDFGEMFRLMRKYDGASQDRISSPVNGLTQSRVSKIIRGDERIATFDLMLRIVDGLRIPAALLGLAARPWETAPALGDNSPAPVTLLPPPDLVNLRSDPQDAEEPAGQLGRAVEQLAG